MCLISISNTLFFAVVVICAGCARYGEKVGDEKRATTAEEEAQKDADRRISSTVVHYYPDNSQLHDIGENDPAHAAMKPFIASIEQRYAGSLISEVVIDYVKEMKGPASRQLFPDYRFFVCRWSEKVKGPLPDGRRLFSAAMVYEALAVDKDLKLTSIGPGTRHDQNFGEFLAEQKVRVTDEKSARLVWDAFCEVRRWLFKTDVIEKVSDREWRLGIYDSDPEEPGRAYYEVHLNEDFTVKSAERIIEDANGKVWK